MIDSLYYFLFLKKKIYTCYWINLKLKTTTLIKWKIKMYSKLKTKKWSYYSLIYCFIQHFIGILPLNQNEFIYFGLVRVEIKIKGWDGWLELYFILFIIISLFKRFGKRNN